MTRDWHTLPWFVGEVLIFAFFLPEGFAFTGGYGLGFGFTLLFLGRRIGLHEQRTGQALFILRAKSWRQLPKYYISPLRGNSVAWGWIGERP